MIYHLLPFGTAVDFRGSRDDSSEYLKDLDKMEDFIERTRIYKQKTIESYFI